jgi:DNA-binding phage protein
LALQPIQGHAEIAEKAGLSRNTLQITEREGQPHFKKTLLSVLDAMELALNHTAGAHTLDADIYPSCLFFQSPSISV